MQLLGPYNSTLQSFHYQALLDLYTQQVASGGYAGVSSFNTAAINALVQASLDFTNLPLPSAGQRVDPDSINTPLNILQARYVALTNEAAAYQTTTNELISVLEKDTAQLDELLAAADLQVWEAQQPQLFPSIKYSWDYGESAGPDGANVIPQIDPLNGVLYATNCPTNTYLDITDGSEFTGLVAPSTDQTYPIRSLEWSWTPMTASEQSEPVYGINWTELNLLEDAPIINFLPNPTVQVQLPINGSVAGILNFAGQSINGALPIYVRTVFSPRRNTQIVVPQNTLLNGDFEGYTTDWTFGDGWALAKGANAHTGLYYAAKAALTPWSAITSYSPGDTISYLGFEYIALTGNINSPPITAFGVPDNSDWARTGVLQSQVFPIAQLNQVYAEFWVKNLGANGILTVSLQCLDINLAPLDPPINLPGITSADNYIEISGVLTALQNPSVAFGLLQVTVFGQTTGIWAVDDFRVHLPQKLSIYSVNQDNVSVYTPLPNSDLAQVVYFDSTDFMVDDISNITIMGLEDGVPYTVRFTENFPAYQCSVNETVWSPLVMLDPSRPYPDGTTVFYPIIIGVDGMGNRTLFPVTDEQGNPTGLTMQVAGQLLFPYYIEVTTPAQPQYGATATLEIDFVTPAYMNGFTLDPFSNYPFRLTKVQVASFATNTIQTIGAPNALLDRPLVLTFPTTLVSSIFLTLYQENYNLSQYVVQAPDQLQREVLSQLQTILPFNIQPPNQSSPTYYNGAQYSIGMENLLGLNSTPVLPGIFVAGPHKFHGIPDIFRYDADYVDSLSVPGFTTYLCWIAYNSAGVEVDSNTMGVLITPGECAVFPFPSPSLLDRQSIDHVDIFLKFVLRNSEIVLQRYLLQVAAA